jgi:cholesterol transport system auxiliary component
MKNGGTGTMGRGTRLHDLRTPSRDGGSGSGSGSGTGTGTIARRLRAGVRSFGALFALAAAAASGCALLGKGDAGAARFFSLEQAAPDRPGIDVAGASGARTDPAPRLRLGRVTGAPHLEERLVFRDSTFEVNYYRELRWTEPPELVLRRLLERGLFEERGLQHVVGGAAPTLDVQLTAFDEIRGAAVARGAARGAAPGEAGEAGEADEADTPRLARAQVIARLHDERLVFWEETLTVDRPVVPPADGDLPLATVAALAEALQAAVDEVADRTTRALAERR